MGETKILAKSKSETTLYAHTKGLLEQLEKLSCVLNNKNFDFKLLKLAIFAHDFGKVSPTFQISVGNWDYSPKVPFPDIPHSLFSLIWIDINNLTKKLNSNDYVRILLSLVAFHHWRDNFVNIILGVDKEFIRAIDTLVKNEDLRNNLLKNLRSQFNKEDFKNFLDILNYSEEIATIITNGQDLFSYLSAPYYNYFLPQKMSLDDEFKKKWIFNAGLLMRIDHFASFLQEEEISEDIEKPFIKYSEVENNLKIILSKKLGVTTFEDENIWQISELKEKKDKNTILIAPTGSGKTEFAYLWGADTKLFFTLPLKSAVNSIYDRSKNVFGSCKVGLLHSDADVYLYERSPNYDGQNARVLDLSRQLSLPVLILTGDQIFPSALRYPGYEKIYATLGYSKLVIDEVQAYNPTAIAIIIKIIEDIVKLGGKFLLMTATLPIFVKKEIEERTHNFDLCFIDKYEDYANICKHKVQLCEDAIINRVNEIIEKAKTGNRVLVILNTVEMAQKVYKKVVEANNNIYIKLLHSRFTLEDRKNIENEVVGYYDENNEWVLGTFGNPKPAEEKNGKILIATQVVEASLDIDADILYTELAPIDSLIQRMGRVLRRIKDKYFKLDESELANIFVFYQQPERDKKLCSGAGSVYQNDLLILSLFLLFREAKPELFNDSVIVELNKKYWSEEKDRNKKNNKKDVSEKFLKELFEKVNNNNYLESVKKKQKRTSKTQKNLMFSLPEDKKKKLVEDLYELLPIQSSYFQKYYNTLDILDAGYMSDKKQESIKIFREIYTVPAIPESELLCFKKSIEDLIHKDNLSYTEFKINVLSKHIVNIDIRKYFRNNFFNLSNLSYLVYEIKGISDGIRAKIKRWLSGIYIFKARYEKDLGVIFEENMEMENSKIIDI